MLKTLKKITWVSFAFVIVLAVLILTMSAPIAQVKNDFAKPTYNAGAQSYTVQIDGEIYNVGDVVEFEYTGNVCEFSIYDDSDGKKMVTVIGAEALDLYSESYIDVSDTNYTATLTVSVGGNIQTMDITYKIAPKKVTVAVANVIKKGNNYYLENSQGKPGQQISPVTFAGAVTISGADVTLSDLGYKMVVSGSEIRLQEIDRNPNYNIINLSTAKATVKQSMDFEGWIPSIAMGGLAIVFLIVFFALMGAINKLKRS